MSDEEPEREVDPPESTPEDTHDEQQGSSMVRVQIFRTGSAVLPSGASYLFNAGETRDLSSKDADWVINQGFGRLPGETS